MSLPLLAPMTIADAVEALRDIGADPVMRHDRHGHEYWAHRCAHPDHHDSWPSATITDAADGALLLNCFSCAPAKGSPARRVWVAEAIGRMVARTPKDPPAGTPKRGQRGTGSSGHGEKVAHYDYIDADGQLIARKVRFQDGKRKSFLWQRPFGESGNWVDGLRGKPLRELPLYGLHSIGEPGSLVYVVEGEKDADRLHAEGVAAVTAAGSAPTDIPADLTPLAGHTCIVIADRDKVGLQLAEGWRDRLVDLGCTVALAASAVMAPKADVSDHLDAGHPLTALEFGPITLPDAPDDAPGTPDSPPTAEPDQTGALAYRIDWAAAYTSEDRAVDWLVEGIVERGRLVSLYSAPKAGKSLVMLDLSAALATGRSVLGQPATGELVPVLYCDYENTPSDVVDRLRDLGYHDPADLAELHYLSLPVIPPLDTAAGGLALLQAAEAVGAQLVIIDTASRTISGEENAADTWTAWYASTGIRFKRAGIALVRLDHSGKDAKKGQRGSSAKAGDVDLVLRLVADGEHLDLLAEERRQSYYAERTKLRRREVDGRLVHQVETTAEAADDQVAQLIAYLDEAGFPADAGRPTIQAHLAERGQRVTKKTLEAALRRRKGGVGVAGNGARQARSGGRFGGKDQAGSRSGSDRAAGSETGSDLPTQKPTAHRLPTDCPARKRAVATDCPPRGLSHREPRGQWPGQPVTRRPPECLLWLWPTGDDRPLHRMPSRRDQPMIPADHLARLIATRTGQGTDRTQRDRAAWSRCGQCRAWTLSGLDDEVAALAAVCDPTPLDRHGEVAALLTGRATYDLHLIPTPRLRWRTAGQISHKPADPADRIVLPAHTCGQPLAPAITLHRRQETTDAPCPF